MILLTQHPELHSNLRLKMEAEALGLPFEMKNPLDIFCEIPSSFSQNEIIIPRLGLSFFNESLRGLRALETAGALSVNSSQGLSLARDKWESLATLAQAGISIPRSLFYFPESASRSWVESFGSFPLVLKTVHGSQGRGVVFLESMKSALSVIGALQASRIDFFIQEFIVSPDFSDLRCLVFEDEVLACVQRKASPGDFRSNFHQGGSSQNFVPSREIEDLALRATQALGLRWAGVDLILSSRGPFVLEVNASPGIEGIEKATSLNLARKVIEKTHQLKLK